MQIVFCARFACWNRKPSKWEMRTFFTSSLVADKQWGLQMLLTSYKPKCADHVLWRQFKMSAIKIFDREDESFVCSQSYMPVNTGHVSNDIVTFCNRYCAKNIARICNSNVINVPSLWLRICINNFECQSFLHLQGKGLGGKSSCTLKNSSVVLRYRSWSKRIRRDKISKKIEKWDPILKKWRPSLEMDVCFTFAIFVFHAL